MKNMIKNIRFNFEIRSFRIFLIIFIVLLYSGCTKKDLTGNWKSVQVLESELENIAIQKYESWDFNCPKICKYFLLDHLNICKKHTYNRPKICIFLESYHNYRYTLKRGVYAQKKGL